MSARPSFRAMCGKFTQQITWEQLVTYANLLKAPAGGSELVTPMRQGRVITLDDAGERRSVPMRWG